MVAPLDRARRGHRHDGRLAARYPATRSPPSDLDFLVGLSQQAAIAIENARLFAEAHEAPATPPSEANQAKSDLPGRDEPRDPDADERDHRDERAAARHAARRRAARLRRDDPDVRRRAADDHQRHPRLLEDRGRQGRARARAVRARARASRARSTSSRPPAAAKHLELAYAVDDEPAARRSSATRAGCARSSSTCCPTRSSSPSTGEVELTRLGPPPIADARARRDGALGVRDRRPRHRHRHPARPDGPPVPVVQPGRRLDLAALRRHRPRAWPSAAAWPS